MTRTADRLAHPARYEQLLARRRARYAADPEYAEAIRERNRTYPRQPAEVRNHSRMRYAHSVKPTMCLKRKLAQVIGEEICPVCGALEPRHGAGKWCPRCGAPPVCPCAVRPLARNSADLAAL